jgi:hypothetical protein
LLSALCIGALLLVHPGTGAYLTDLGRAAAAGASGPGIIRLERIVPALSANLTIIVITVVMVLGLSRTSRGASEEREANVLALAAVVIMAASVVVGSQSHDTVIPALVLPVVLAYTVTRRRAVARRDHRWVGTRVAALVVLGFTLPSIGYDVQAILYQAVMSRSATTIPLVARQNSPISEIRLPGRGEKQESYLDYIIDGTLKGFIYDKLYTATDAAWNLDGPRILADGVDLLSRHNLTHAKIASLTFSQSFPVLLESPPPLHMLAWHDFRRTFGPADAARASQILSDTDVVLVPEVWKIEGLWDTYRDAIERDFDRIDQTAIWQLWVRRTSPIR